MAKRFNARKLPREHYLFLKKRKKLSFTKCEKFTDINENEHKYFDTGIISLYKNQKIIYVSGGFFKKRSLFEIYNKITKTCGTKSLLKKFEVKSGGINAQN